MDSNKEHQYRAALKTAKSSILVLQDQLAALSEPIAVIGMSCLFPGLYPEDAASPETFFRQLLAGTDSVVDVPPERLEQWVSRLPEEDRPKVPGLRRAALLGRDAYAFDSAFFSLPPAEARMTDPQHLLLLELAQTALWDAGLPLGAEPGADTGVFCGKSGTDHLFDILGTGRLSADDPYTLTGNMHSALAGRISYFFDWTGPCISCETACSTALTATMQAVRSLRGGECGLALAGAVNLLLGPTPSHWLAAMQALAPDGRCKAFGAGADGFGRGEGGGVLVLQKLSDAQAQGNRIHAVILGGAVGSDGKSRNFTSPSAKGQRTVIARALRDAALHPDEVAFVETHGTGTPLGDPIEAESLAAVYKQRKQPLLIGSVKSNVAHLEAAAGMAALIKCIMAVRESLIPETLHADPVNPLLELDKIGLELCHASRPWPSGYARRVAGASAFSISGSLAHILIAEPPGDIPKARPVISLRTRMLPLAARNEEQLVLQAREALEKLEAGTPFAQLCDSAANARPLRNPLLPERLAVCASEQDAPAVLRAYTEGKRQRAVLRGRLPKTPPTILFLFSGQGSQVPGMGRRLYELFPVFREVLDRCDAMAAPSLGSSLLEALFSGEDEPLRLTRFTQPAIYSHQAALTALLKSWGVLPSAVLGHSIGEYAAAYATGVFSLEDGLALTLRRGELVQALHAEGGMAAVLGSEEQVAALLEEFPQVSIAAINGADTVTLAGEAQALAAALARLAASGVEHRPMPVSHAFHCPLVEPALPDFFAYLRGKNFNEPSVPFLSSRTGAYLTAPCDWPDYFTRQMRDPVRFYDAVKTAQEDIFLEIGAGPTLSSFGRQIRRDAQWLFAQNATGQNDPDEERPLAFALARLYSLGLTPDFAWLRAEPWRPECAPMPRFIRTRAEAAPSPPESRTQELRPREPRQEPPPLPKTTQPAANAGTDASSLDALVQEQKKAFAAVCALQQTALKMSVPPSFPKDMP